MSLPNWEKNYNSLQNKVDKVEGKELSTNDFTDEYKNKVDSFNVTESTLSDPNGYFSTIDYNRVSRYGRLVEVFFRGLLQKNVTNNSILLQGLPSAPQGTNMLGIGERYTISDVKWFYFPSDSNAIKTSELESGKWVHISFMYLSKN